jgi:DNA-binding winged helix-turn-helix (wHTH) protein
MLGRAEAGGGGSAGEPGAVRQPGADGTLLAVVPIPGTGTSLAIVGYPVTAQGSMAGAADAASASQVLDHRSLDHSGTAGERPGLLLDHDQRRVWVDGAEVTLTFQEFELLAFLAAHPATVFSRADLVREVWQRDFAADSRTVDVHVSRLRHKLGPSYGRCLVTEYRVGYQFRPLAADVRACLADRDAEEDALFAFHRRTVVIPVRVLA